MSAEVHASKRLAIRTNGVFSPTDRGHLAHELVAIQKTLGNDSDPNVQFSMSDGYRQRCLVRKEELCGVLGLPTDEKVRGREIRIFDMRLTKVGLPYYRTINK